MAVTGASIFIQKDKSLKRCNAARARRSPPKFCKFKTNQSWDITSGVLWITAASLALKIIALDALGFNGRLLLTMLLRLIFP